MRAACRSRWRLILLLYTALGVATVVVLRAMSRRWREADDGEPEVPYGPRPSLRRDGGLELSKADAVGGSPVGRRRPSTPCSAAPTSAPGCGRCSPAAASAASGPAPLIDWAIGPVWEANHVWLIFVLVVLWTAFSEAFGSIFSTLFIPLSLAALGIVLRGAGFAFHRVAARAGGRRVAEALFGVSSVLTPFFMGTVVGAIASGRVPVGNADRATRSRAG